MRALLLRLAELGEDGDDVRRRATLDEVVMSPTHERVLDALVTHRLVTVDADRGPKPPTKRCSGSGHGCGAGSRRTAPGANSIAAWHPTPWGVGDAASRPNDQLYRGVRLEAAVEWSAQHHDELHPVERKFLETGTSAWQLELASARRTEGRRLRVLAASLAVLLTLAVAAGVLALNQRDQAQTRASVAEATRIAQLSELALDDQELETASLLAVEGWREHQTDATEGALLSAAQEYGSSSQVLPIDIESSDVSSNDVIASPGFNSGGVTLWDIPAAKRSARSTPRRHRPCGSAPTALASPSSRTTTTRRNAWSSGM